MHRFFVENKIENKIIIDGDDFHHIRNVIKLKIKETIECVFDNAVFLCKIIEFNADSLTVEILEQKEVSKKKITSYAAVGIIREQKFDIVLQKLGELGVDYIIPIIFSRNVVKIKPEDEKKKINRWSEILISSAKQSKQIKITKIEPIIRNLKDIEKYKQDFNIVAWEESNFKLSNLENEVNKNVLFVVGPEGGISEKEIKILENLNFKNVSLGENILRAETASIFIASILNYISMK